ncbi:hypothetical protein MMC07_007591 [Pseudocyphellaria aurata]|nr:hypothetical protein [Pseudocyphellaria aurata]
MLRRKPTAITLTSEDIAAYEESRRFAASFARMAENANPNDGSGGAGGGGALDPNDELKPLPGDKSRLRAGAPASREERILGR